MWLALLLPMISALPFLSPPMGWSTWNTFGCHINETLIQSSILALNSSKLRASGYEYVLIDDCWTTCADRDPSRGHCKVASFPSRDKDGKILIDPKKFPNGFKPLTDMAHAHNLKIGIYTSVSERTCGGFTGSWQHEEIDAKAFVEWGFDFVKHDTCGLDYTVHDGGMQNATMRMREGLFAAGNGSIVYYLDSGNPSSPQRVFNPHQRWITSPEALLKLATHPTELVWRWATQWNDGKGPHIFKSWRDIGDDWESTLENVHNQIRIAEYQKPGQLNTPDMLTLGMGSMSQGQYRAQFFLWCVLGAPLIMGNDIRVMDDFTVALATSPEVLTVDQDPDCIQGSMARASGATETWIKPLHDNTFAVVFVNKGTTPTNATLYIADDFFPADFHHADVRDLYAQKDLGLFTGAFITTLPAMDAMIFKITPHLEPPN